MPHVWHVRELIGPGKPIRLPFKGSKFGPYVARYSSKLIANSEVTASLIRNFVPAGLLELVPNGIDLSRFTPRKPTASGRLVVGMVANPTSRVKKHALFIEAASLVDRICRSSGESTATTLRKTGASPATRTSTRCTSKFAKRA